jgi:hypothetical protein
MRLRSLALLAAALFVAAPARAQVQYPVDQIGGVPGTAPGFVNLCPTSLGTFKPCGTAGALPIAPPPQAPPAGFSFTNIAATGTTVIKTGSGVLHTVCTNTPAATGTLQMYDNTAGSGTKIGLITSFASVSGCFTYDVAFNNGLTVVAATAAPDFTISWR